MTTFQIDTNDKNVIEKAKKLLIDNLHLNVKVMEEVKIQRKTKGLSKSLDEKIRNAKSTNTTKANELKKTMEGLNSLIDSTKKSLTTGEAREQYFNSKVI